MLGICDECGKKMSEGFCIDAGAEYYCTEKCLHKHYTKEQWAEMYDDGNSDSYWTTWEEDDLCEEEKQLEQGQASGTTWEEGNK